MNLYYPCKFLCPHRGAFFFLSCEDVQQTIVESSKFAVLSLTRVGGVSGELEADI